MLSTLDAALQQRLPGWVRARGLAVHLVVFQGGQALTAPCGVCWPTGWASPSPCWPAPRRWWPVP
ncbi:MFS transporter [Streptomyces daghestanicus]|uniref:MFS transporter n=1 Tax=Streptomyces daghestanicus TaxID=66885 RepID=UPI001E2A3C92|nr:MFS transporter [Streptomyces daghestanicus]